MKVKARDLAVSALVVVGGAALAVKKLVSDEESKQKLKDTSKKLADDTKEFGKAFSAVSENVASNLAEHGRHVVNEAKDIVKEAKEKIKEKEAETTEAETDE